VDKPLAAAITAAVNCYVEGEKMAAAGTPVSAANPWKQFGRQELMRLRTTMQRRARRRSR